MNSKLRGIWSISIKRAGPQFRVSLLGDRNKNGFDRKNVAFDHLSDAWEFAEAVNKTASVEIGSTDLCKRHNRDNGSVIDNPRALKLLIQTANLSKEYYQCL